MVKTDNSVLPKIKIAAANIRRSSRNQSGNHSFEIQKQAIMDSASEKGYYLPEENIFYDDAVSAFHKASSNRKGLNQLKQFILKQDIQAVFFYDFSRIDRKIYSFVSEFYYEVIAKKPTLKFYTTTRQDSWTPEDLDVKFQLIIANAESQDKHRRSVDSQDTILRNKSLRPGSATPYGFNQINKVLVPNEKASNVLFIYYLASWGYSVQKIASVMNDAGIPSPSNKRWRSSTIDNILKNPAYLGDLDWKFSRKEKGPRHYYIENTHQVIVPKMLNQIIDMNRILKKRYNKLETPFLFGSLLNCGNCGEMLDHRNSSTKRNSISYNYLKYFCRTCSYEIEADELNESLLVYMQNKLKKTMQINSEYITNSLKDYIKILDKARKVDKAQLDLVLANDKLAKELQKEKILINILKKVKTRFETRISKLEQSIHKMESLLTPTELNTFLNSFQNVDLGKLSRTEQRLFILYFVKNIEISYLNNSLTYDVQFDLNPISFVNHLSG